MAHSPRFHRILYVVARGDAFGGSSLHVMDMATRLSEEGHSVRVLVGGTPDMEVPTRYAGKGIDFVCIPEMGREIDPINDLRAVFGIRRAIRRFQPDLISLHASKAGALGRIAAFGCRRPVLYTPHCWSFVEGFPKARIFRLVEKSLAPFCNRIITVSDDERQFGLSSGVGKSESTLTIHNGVKDRFPVSNKAIHSPDSVARIVMVGRFEEQKDQRLLLNALAPLAGQPWKLTFVGDGPLREECVAMTRELGLENHIVFSGYSESVGDELSEHDIFALITHWEGFPRSILEAMAASLPVIATDIGGSRESVVEGETGFLVPHGDPEILRKRLNSLISDPSFRDQLGSAGRERFINQFTFETMFSRYRELYDEIIGGSLVLSPTGSVNYPNPAEVSSVNPKAAPLASNREFKAVHSSPSVPSSH